MHNWRLWKILLIISNKISTKNAYHWLTNRFRKILPPTLNLNSQAKNSKLINSHWNSAITDSNLLLLSESNKIENYFKRHIHKHYDNTKRPHNIVTPEEYMVDTKQEST